MLTTGALALLASLLPPPQPAPSDLGQIVKHFHQKRVNSASPDELKRIASDFRAQLTHWLADHPKDKDAPLAACHLANSHLWDGDYAKAREALRGFLKGFPAAQMTPENKLKFGVTLTECEDDDAAREIFQAFLRAHPDHKDAFWAKLYAAVALHYLRKPGEAEAEIAAARDAHREQPESWAAVLRLAALQHAAGKHSQARTTLEGILTACPDRGLKDAAERHLGAYLKIGQDAPAFGETDASGASVSLEALRGKVVVLYFFASGRRAAEPMIEEALALRRVAEAHKGGDFQVVGVSVDTNKGDFDVLRGNASITAWPLLFDGKGLKGTLALLYDVRGLPSRYVIDRQGKLRYFNLDGRDLAAAVTRLLEEK